jgi:hypothetical protein
MATPEKKLFCVLEYHTSKSVVTVQRAFRAKDPPTDKTIRAWYKQLLKLGVCASRNQEVQNIDAPMLTSVWQELKYRIDVCRVTRGAHIEHL